MEENRRCVQKDDSIVLTRGTSGAALPMAEKKSAVIRESLRMLWISSFRTKLCRH
jgi:hypothetical protein